MNRHFIKAALLIPRDLISLLVHLPPVILSILHPLKKTKIIPLMIRTLDILQHSIMEAQERFLASNSAESDKKKRKRKRKPMYYP